MLGCEIQGTFCSNWKPALPAHEVPGQVQRRQQRDQRDAEREAADVAIAPREDDQQQRAPRAAGR